MCFSHKTSHQLEQTISDWVISALAGVWFFVFLCPRVVKLTGTEQIVLCQNHTNWGSHWNVTLKLAANVRWFVLKPVVRAEQQRLLPVKMQGRNAKCSAFAKHAGCKDIQIKCASLDWWQTWKWKSKIGRAVSWTAVIIKEAKCKILSGKLRLDT